MDNQYNQYFKSLLGKKNQEFATPKIGQTPQLQNYFASENVLGNPDAQNSAQRADGGANNLREAYEALYRDPVTLEAIKKNQEAKMFESEQAEKKYPPNYRVFAGSFYETDNQGRLKTEMYDIAQKMNSGQLLGFAPMGGSGINNSRGRQSVQYPQTNTSNVAKYGETPRTATEFETHLARIRGTQPGVETFGNSQDRARFESQAYKAKAMAEAQAEKNAKDQE